MRTQRPRRPHAARIGIALALATTGLGTAHASPFGFDDIAFWTGSGASRAGLVIHWSAPINYGSSEMPAPIADAVLGWGYQFDGSPSGTDMLDAIVAADARLFAVVAPDGALLGLGYDANNDGAFSLSDGVTTFEAGDFVDGKLTLGAYADADDFKPVGMDNFYWGGWFGPNWESWREAGVAGGFTFQPDRGPDEFATPSDWTEDEWGGYYQTFTHGEWTAEWAGMPLADGAWLGFSVARAPWGETENTWNKQAPAVIPEPGTLASLLVGAFLLRAARRRRPRDG